MSVTIPEGISTLGNTKVKAVVSVASQTAPKLATEINAATSVDISCYLFPEGWSPTGSTAKGQKKRRLCSKRNAEALNSTTYSIGALQYVHNPTADDAAAGNEARELLQEGTKVFFVEAQGVDGEEGVIAAGDVVRTHYLELGPQIWSGDNTDENGEFFVMQEAVYVNGSGPVIGTVAT